MLSHVLDPCIGGLQLAAHLRLAHGETNPCEMRARSDSCRARRRQRRRGEGGLIDLAVAGVEYLSPVTAPLLLLPDDVRFRVLFF